MLAGDLLALTLYMMARIPWVEQAWGRDTIIRAHRILGFVTFALIVAHVLLTTTSQDSPLLGVALLGTITMVIVVISSTRVRRRKKRYESWHKTHLWSYLGIALAVPHMVVIGQDLASPGARVYWILLFALGFLACVVFRLVLPLWRSRRSHLRVKSITDVGYGCSTIVIEGQHLDRWHARSGQFFNWRFQDGKGLAPAHPYSLSSPPNDSEFTITVRGVGDGSTHDCRVPIGTHVLVEGPYGTMTPALRPGNIPRPAVLIGAGVGIAPLKAIAEDLVHTNISITIIYRFTDETDCVLLDDLLGLDAHDNLTLYPLPGHRRSDDSWLCLGADSALSDSEQLLAWAPQIQESDVFICGPGPWQDLVRKSVRLAGVRPDHIKSEEFSW
jgi:predicted ferric reductase